MCIHLERKWIDIWGWLKMSGTGMISIESKNGELKEKFSEDHWDTYRKEKNSYHLTFSFQL